MGSEIMVNINCDFKDGYKKFGKTLTPISRMKLLIGEGKDECNFFWVFLKYLGIGGVQIIEIGGNDFKRDLPALKNRTGFNKAEIIAITCDADTNSNSTYDRMKHAIKQMGFEAPIDNGTYTDEIPKVGLYIFPG